jgi:predicted esterase
MEQTLSITASATYEKLGKFDENTQQIWLVCHGFGQLAKYFIRRFDILDAEKNLIIAPQGLSKFYLNGQYDKVGASWLTKENREMDLANTLNYLHTIYETEIKSHLENPKVIQNIQANKLKINILGFSQGVSIACRWAVECQIPFDKLVLWAGRFPSEIQKEQLKFVKSEAEIILIVGDKDEFYRETYIEEEKQKLTNVIKPPKIIVFDGTHEVRREVLEQVI